MKSLLLAIVAAMLWLISNRAHADAATRRAVIVGANAAAPGRKALRYAHSDARKISEVLTRVGGFGPDSIRVLLDPDPSAVLATLDEALSAFGGAGAHEGMILFYYSGHADAQQLYPAGKPLPLRELRRRLEDPRAPLRLGVVDICRGGGWTGVKGVGETAEFEVAFDLPLQNEGSVFIASSSGLESAHESEGLLGSYFTHHWNAALLGAADDNGDGAVSLREAYDFASQWTIRDTSVQLGRPQRPSFQMQLTGRRDVALTQLTQRSTGLLLVQDHGPLSILHLESGLLLAQTESGPRRIRLAVPAGRYIVRSASQGRVRAQEVEVLGGGASVVYERQLAAVDLPATESKAYVHARPLLSSVVGKGKFGFTLYGGFRSQDAFNGRSLLPAAADQFRLDDPWYAALLNLREGVRLTNSALVPELLFAARYGLSDRLQWEVGTLALTYLGGEPGGFEWLLSAGVLPRELRIDETARGIGTRTNVSWQSLVQLDLRWWFSPRTALLFGVGLRTTSGWIDFRDHCQANAAGCLGDLADWSFSHALRSRSALTLIHTLGDRLTVSLGVGFNQTLASSLHNEYSRDGFSANATFLYGAVQTLGLRPLPTLQLHLSDSISADLIATGSFAPESGSHGFELLAGLQALF